jgi:hypothetical protein
MRVFNPLSALATCLVVAVIEASDSGSSSSNYDSSSSSSTSYSSSSNKYGAYGTNFFADTLNAYYDGYQQAWRYLGWYVKCGYPSDRYDDGDGSGDHSGDEDEDSSYQGNNYCQRYLIWAAVSRKPSAKRVKERVQ